MGDWKCNNYLISILIVRRHSSARAVFTQPAFCNLILELIEAYCGDEDSIGAVWWSIGDEVSTASDAMMLYCVTGFDSETPRAGKPLMRIPSFVLYFHADASWNWNHGPPEGTDYDRPP
jgi:hypothetical protein